MDHRDPIYDRLLEPEVMKAAREALCSQYRWFRHVSPLQNFEGIKRLGLEPRDPGFIGYQPSSLEIIRCGPNWRNIICLSPFGSDLKPHSRRFCVAIHRDHLPSRVALDYSFPDLWKNAAQFKSTMPRLTDVEIFVRVIDRASSIACYDAIPSEHLRVWVVGTPIDRPEDWPELRTTELPSEWIY
jgi:hypothetical protein